MSEPITLYGPEPFEGVVRWVVAGIFEERAWCATHDLPVINPLGECSALWDQAFDPGCEPEPRLVQKVEK